MEPSLSTRPLQQITPFVPVQVAIEGIRAGRILVVIDDEDRENEGDLTIAGNESRWDGHNTGRAGKKYLPETLGAGVAMFDADHDGWPDLLFINGRDWTGGKKSPHALYRNNKNGTFTNVTSRSGLDVSMYGMGVDVADYDNDGQDYVFITAIDSSSVGRQRNT